MGHAPLSVVTLSGGETGMGEAYGSAGVFRGVAMRQPTLKQLRYLTGRGAAPAFWAGGHLRLM
jgi:hypothetical protein